MRYIYTIIVLFAVCGCSRRQGAGTSDEAAALLAFPDMHNDASALRERQTKIAAELDYYLRRHDVKDEGYDVVVRYAEEGDSTMATWLPRGRLRLSTTLRPREGKGLTHDARGRLVVGWFRADTLVSGLRFDAEGIYAGQLDRRGEAWGHGSYRSLRDDSYYEGHWAHDQREGFGLSIAPTHLKVGTWLYDRFRGERMSYHSERIYGIDISRHQHEKRGRRLPLSWKRPRIVHLGRRISQERVLDAVDYPVRFVYIKSTEGVTIENRYFLADYEQARGKGLRVGAYHFFTTRTPAAEQAQHFVAHTRFTRGDMPPMLDVEPSEQQIEQMGGALALLEGMRVWLRAVERATGTRPLIYINQNFANTYLPLAPDLKADYQFWIARYGEYKPDLHLAIWQLSDCGRVEGFTGDVDLNVFNGYEGQWEEFLRESTVK